PAALPGGGRLARASPRRPRRGLRRATGGARSAQRPRHERGADLRAPAPAWLRAHHRGAGSARPQHRGCAHHADRRRLQSRALSPARGRRRADHRRRPADRDRAGAVALAPGTRRCAVRGVAARAAPGLRGRTVSDPGSLRAVIDAAFERRAELGPGNVPPDLESALEECLTLLDSGEARVAEPGAGGWVVNEWLKKAVLLSFRT